MYMVVVSICCCGGNGDVVGNIIRTSRTNKHINTLVTL